MMKKITTLFFVAYTFLEVSAQFGINTDHPQGTLDVVGGTLVESYMIDTVNSPATGDYFLITRSKDTDPVGKVKLLDISLRNVAPVNTYNIIVNNVKEDEVVDLNTGLETDKYVIAITGAVFSNATSATITSTSPKSYGAYSTEVTQVMSGGKKYHAINLSFKGTGTTSAQNGTWTIALAVYEKSLIKDWGTYTGTVYKVWGYTGISTNTPLGLQ